MLTALVLVCSLAAIPDLRQCDEGNALDVLRVPAAFGSPATCFMHGQAFLAGSELGRRLGPDERLKVVCAPSHRLSAQARERDG
jgi:hypothetical protein